MRIALIAPLVAAIAQPYVGGAQVFVAELAKGLTRRGHSVTLFARDGSAVPGVPLEPIKVPEIVRPSDFSTPAQRPADPGFFAQANIFLELFLNLRRRQDEFDLIHANAFDWPCFACSALIDALPVIHTVHLPAVTPEINEALRALHRQGHAQTLVTVSRACARTYAEYTSFDEIIYDGLDLDAVPFAAAVPENAPLLFAGRITPEKGVEAAIEIAERARAHLLIAGGIYDRRYYEERIMPLLKWAGECVTYLGHLELQELWQRMGQVRGVLFPIQWDEPFGRVAIEAMAAGTPVIAFRRGAAEEIIRHGETGFLVNPGDCARAAALVAALPTLSRAACRAHVARHFSFERTLDAYEALYASLLP